VDWIGMRAELSLMRGHLLAFISTSLAAPLISMLIAYTAKADEEMMGSIIIRAK
jgi:hypothetical protein